MRAEDIIASTSIDNILSVANVFFFSCAFSIFIYNNYFIICFFNPSNKA